MTRPRTSARQAPWRVLLAAAAVALLGFGRSAAFVGRALPSPRSLASRHAGVQPHLPLESLKVAVVGGGPSGLLLAHRLLEFGATVDLFEGRSDPRSPEAELEGRAYALGLGIRGRTAIRNAGGAELWDKIRPAGFGSERFKLHLPFGPIDLRTPEDGDELEPSLLIYQSDLCASMLEELESRYLDSGRLRTCFGAQVESVDAVGGTIVLRGEQGGSRTFGPVDMVAGCDGVNSAVRAGMAEACSGLEVRKVALPGSLKVLRFPKMPSALDPTAVHAIPGKGGCSAFMEPTARGACALINWRDAPAKADGEQGQGGDAAAVDWGGLASASEARDALAKSFPLLVDVIDEEAGRQFVEQEPSQAATVRCNTYHHGKAVLLGDAAHSTGGASGQGCNSALQDAAVLADLLAESPGDVAGALRRYSLQRVPEGRALLDLSLGPGEEVGFKRILYGVATTLGNLLSRLGIGEKTVQTLLTTTLTPFADIRRDRDFYFGDFPAAAEFEKTILELEVAGAQSTSKVAESSGSLECAR